MSDMLLFPISLSDLLVHALCLSVFCDEFACDIFRHCYKVQSLVLVLFIQKAAPRISNVCKKLNNKCQVGCLNACKGMTSFIKILSELKKGC